MTETLMNAATVSTAVALEAATALLQLRGARAYETAVPKGQAAGVSNTGKRLEY